MKTPEGRSAAISQAVIVTADPGRVRELQFELTQRGYQVTTLTASGLRALDRTFDLGVFDLSSGEGNPVVLAADLLAGGRLQHVEFTSPDPSSDDRALTVPLEVPEGHRASVRRATPSVSEAGPGIERANGVEPAPPPLPSKQAAPAA
jgi:hypothetical protein